MPAAGPLEREDLERAFRTSRQVPPRADQEDDHGETGNARAPRSAHPHDRQQHDGPQLGHRGEAQGDPAQGLATMACPGDAPRRERDRHQIEAQVEEREQRQAEQQVDDRRPSSPPPRECPRRREVGEELYDRDPGGCRSRTAPGEDPVRQRLQRHRPDRERAVGRGRRRRDPFRPEDDHVAHPSASGTDQHQRQDDDPDTH